jgi:hypothetical protein
MKQSKTFRDFFDSERSEASQKRTKQARVKTRGSFYTASVDLTRSLGRSRMSGNCAFRPKTEVDVWRSLGPRGGSRSQGIAVCDEREGDRMGDQFGRTWSSPSISRAEMVVRTTSLACVPGQGRPRCIVARLSHSITSPARHRWE